MRKRTRCRSIIARHLGRVAVSAIATLFPAVAWGQFQTPPQPSLNRYPQPWVGFLIIFVLLVMVIGVSLIPSKRGHQD